jgi:hypothetical protein
MKTEDFKWLAGQWRVSAYGQTGPVVAIEGVIYESGACFIASRGAGAPSSPGR